MTFPGRLRSAALAALFLATLTLPALAAVTPKRSPAMTALRLPLRFEQNQGQTAAPVRYLARGRGYTLFLTPSEAVLSLRPGKKASSTSDVIRMHLVKGSQTPRMEALDALPGESNYLIGRNPKDWRRGVPGYGRVAERGVYPGIDLIYYGNQQQLEYDFVVAPNADPSRIALQMEGASHVTIDRDGNLVLSNHDGSVTLRHPTIYQMEGGHRVPVSGRFVRKGKNKVSFHLGAYDHQKQLVIDPVLEYASYLGGSGNDYANAITEDSQGNIYIVGRTQSTDFPLANAMQTTCKNGCNQGAGDGDAFITKIDPTMPKLVYSTYFGGNAGDSANTVAVDQSGDTYIAGSTHSTDLPVKSAYQSTCIPCSGNGSSAFIAELNPTGSGIVFSTYLGPTTGSSSVTNARGLAIDGSGGVYVLGDATNGFPTTAGAIGSSSDCLNNNSFLSKLSSAGSDLVYSGCLAGMFFGPSVNAQGEVYITGRSTAIPTTPDAFQRSLPVGHSGFPTIVARVKADGSGSVYVTYVDGSASDAPAAIAIDKSGDAYVTGTTTSSDFPVLNAVQPKCHGCTQGVASNAFIFELNPTGTGLVFSTFLGGSFNDYGAAIAVDSAGDVFASGMSDSSDFPALQSWGAVGPGTSSTGRYLVELTGGGTKLEPV